MSKEETLTVYDYERKLFDGKTITIPRNVMNRIVKSENGSAWTCSSRFERTIVQIINVWLYGNGYRDYADMVYWEVERYFVDGGLDNIVGISEHMNAILLTVSTERDISIHELVVEIFREMF